MPDFKDRMADYVPVSERIEQFYKAHPEGSIQSEIVELTVSRVTVKAYAYRTPDDTRPGIGHSSLDIPGSTPYTRGSEIENCETSSWGRAIAALGFEVKRGVASAEEVRNKQPQDDERGRSSRAVATPARTHPAASPLMQGDGELRDAVTLAARRHGLGDAALRLMADRVGVPKGQRATADQLETILALIETPSSGVPTAETGGEAAPARAVASPDNPQQSEGIAARAVSDAAATPPADLPPPPGVAPTMDDILAVTGGEEVKPRRERQQGRPHDYFADQVTEPPKPGTDAYRLLPSGRERAAAKAYWDKRKAGEPEQESLAIALGAELAE